MRKWNRVAALALSIGGGLGGGGLLLAGPAAAAPTQQQLTCDGLGSITISTPVDHSSDQGGWSSAQIVGTTGHLTPTSFSFTAYDDTTQMVLFSNDVLKGGGNANQNQQTISCVQTEQGTLSDFTGGATIPGTQPTDQVTVTFVATAVPKP